MCRWLVWLKVLLSPENEKLWISREMDYAPVTICLACMFRCIPGWAFYCICWTAQQLPLMFTPLDKYIQTTFVFFLFLYQIIPLSVSATHSHTHTVIQNTQTYTIGSCLEHAVQRKETHLWGGPQVKCPHKLFALLFLLAVSLKFKD